MPKLHWQKHYLNILHRETKSKSPGPVGPSFQHTCANLKPRIRSWDPYQQIFSQAHFPPVQKETGKSVRKHLQAGEAFPPSQSLSSLSRMSKTVVAISQDIFFRVPVYLQFNMSKKSLCQCVCANCKQNLLNTFLDKRELISVVVPFIIFVTLLRIELSYVLNACQMRNIMLALTEKCISSLQNVAEWQKPTGSFVGSRPFVNGTISNLASSSAPADKLWSFK